MAINLSLKQLYDLFAEATSNFAPFTSNKELPESIRQFAKLVRQVVAQLTVLTAHMNRVEGKINAEAAARKALDGHIAELAELIMVARQKPVDTAAAAPAGAPNGSVQATEPGSPEEEAEDLEAKILAESEAEIAAANAAPAAIVPMRQVNGGEGRAS
jgi:hypothetical protein